MPLSLDPRTSEILSQYLKPAGIGAGIGAAGMGLSDLMGQSDEKNPNKRITKLLKSMALGAGMGAGGGIAAQSLKDIMSPRKGSPADLETRGFPKELQSTHSYDPFTRPWAAAGTSLGVGAGTQYAANKMLAPKDISGIKAPGPITWGGVSPTDPYFDTAAQAKAGPMGTGKGAAKAHTDALKDAKGNLEKTFLSESGYINSLGDGGPLSREAINRIRLEQSQSQPNLANMTTPSGKLTGWNPALSSKLPTSSLIPLGADASRLYSMVNTMGMSGQQMTPLQKLIFSVYNPVAGTIGKLFPEFAYGDSHNATANLDPLHIQPKGLKNQNGLGKSWIKNMMEYNTKELPVVNAQGAPVSGNPTFTAINRLAYMPKSKAIQGVLEGPGMMYGRGRYAAGPAAALGTFGLSQYLGQNTLDNATKEVLQKGGPKTPDIMKGLAHEHFIKSNKLDKMGPQDRQSMMQQLGGDPSLR